MIGIPRAIGAVFERQSQRLDTATRATLDLAAVLGRRLTEVALYTAIDLTPGQAAEALSRLRDEGYFREVSGDLEFRNELIRAQSYYAIAVTIRQHLHRKVAELLAAGHSQDDKAISLEIAWHHLRGGDVMRALPFAIEGSEAVLRVGAPHGAEEILSAITDLGMAPSNPKRVWLLLARALVDQSKVEPALPIIETLARDGDLDIREQAKLALEASKRTGEPDLISQALFECARAGSEEGSIDLIRAAEAGIQQLGESTTIEELPMAILTKAFCRFSLCDPCGALPHLETIARLPSGKVNKAQLAYIYSGIGIANTFLGRLEAACTAHSEALHLAREVGDDTRVSQIAANLCTTQMSRGNYEEAIGYGEMSVRLGKASSSSSLLTSYTNLMDPYLLTGRQGSAMECLENARRWLVPERRWKLHCAFFVEAASFALVQRNHALALDLIAQLEMIARDRENGVPMPGPFWKLKAFRRVHLGHVVEAQTMVQLFTESWKHACPYHYLDILAAKVWMEWHHEGRLNKQTEAELEIFDTTGAVGKRTLLTLQGFLQPRPTNQLLTSKTTTVSSVAD
jgi:tetratricopeptide (TPR) repeat protein